MLAKLFAAGAGRAGDGLQAIETLQATCETSLEATAIGYAQTTRDPVAVIRNSGSIIDSAGMSSLFDGFPGS